jgi:hypothetical protein
MGGIIFAPLGDTVMGLSVLVSVLWTLNSVPVAFVIKDSANVSVCSNGGSSYTCGQGQYISGTACTGIQNTDSQTCTGIPFISSLLSP